MRPHSSHIPKTTTGKHSLDLSPVKLSMSQLKFSKNFTILNYFSSLVSTLSPQTASLSLNPFHHLWP